MIFRPSAAARADTHTQGRARQQEASEDVCVCVWAGVGEGWRGCEQCAQLVQFGLDEGCMQGGDALGLRGGGCRDGFAKERDRRRCAGGGVDAGEAASNRSIVPTAKFKRSFFFFIDTHAPASGCNARLCDGSALPQSARLGRGCGLAAAWLWALA